MVAVPLCAAPDTCGRRDFKSMRNLFQSVVTRFVAFLVLGGTVMSLLLGALESHRAEARLQLEFTHQITMTVRHLQNLLRPMLAQAGQPAVEETLRVFGNDAHITALCIHGNDATPVIVGDWPDDVQTTHALWALPEQGPSGAQQIDMHQPTCMRAPFTHDGQSYQLELLIDGPSARRQASSTIFRNMATIWLIIATLVLLGLMMIRQWLTGPLSQMVDLVHGSAGAQPFLDLSRRHTGEFAQLAQAVGSMLNRLDHAAAQLRDREDAYRSLYQFAPVAMVELDLAGMITQANQRAAKLLSAADESDLEGQAIVDFVHPDHRSLLAHTLQRIDLAGDSCGDVVLGVGGVDIDVQFEAVAVRDAHGRPDTVRLSLVDVSQSRQLQRDLSQKTKLLNLLIDHMSDAIVLIGPDGRIAAHNQKLTALLNYPSSGRHDALVGRTYDVESFWDELRVEDHDSFVGRLRLAEAQPHPVQEKVRAGAGVFLFQVVPVHEGGDGAASMDAIGRLWVVREITAIEQNQRLLEQQSMQIQSLRRLGEQLNEVGDTYELLERTVCVIRQVGSVDAVGLALRCDHDDRRSHQVIDLGGASSLVETGQHIVEAVERHLMPEVLMNDQTAFWPDLPEPAPWSTTFDHAGLTTLAAAPLRGRDDAHGVIWIAKRGGDRLDRHHIHLLEAVRPIITAHIDAALLRTQLRTLRLTDHVTQLPNHQMFGHMMEGMLQRPGHRWAIMLIKLDHFGQLNERLDHDQADGVLRSISAIIKANCRTSTFLARLHSATFAIILTPDSPDTHVALAHRLQQLVADQQIELSDGESWHFTASVGIACCPDDTTAQNLFDLAASRLEAARRTGRNRVVSDGPDPERFVG